MLTIVYSLEKSKDNDKVIQDLQEPEDKDKDKFLLNKEDNVAGFSGI